MIAILEGSDRARGRDRQAGWVRCCRGRGRAGQKTLRGLRYPVEMIVGLPASGMTTEEILADSADLEADDVLAALEYAALVTRTRSSVPISAA